MKGKKFLALTLVFIFFVLSSYFMLYDSLVIKDKITSHSYKHFLLQHTEPPRIIFESGSNSHHSINSKMVEKELGITTINLADNAGYPLEYKIYRLERYAQKGDVIIFPLEWGHYSYSKNSDVFINNLFSHLNFYYNSLSFNKKFLTAYNTSFQIVLLEMVKEDPNKRASISEFFNHLKEFEGGGRGDFNYKGPMPLVGPSREMICEEFILSFLIKSNFKISDVFKRNVQLAKKLRKKGANVYFTWPAVVGDNCYSGKYKDELDYFASVLRSYIQDEGFEFIGNYMDSWFPQEMILNTYYHVNDAGRDLRTAKLIEEIKFMSPAFLKYKSAPRLNVENINEAVATSIPVTESNYTEFFNSKSYQEKVVMTYGWSNLEEGHVWSLGDESELMIKVNNPGNKKIKINILAHTYMNNDKTKIYINNKLAEEILINGGVALEVNEHLNNSDVITIRFEYQNVKSPKEHGRSGDSRRIKLSLTSLNVEIVD